MRKITFSINYEGCISVPDDATDDEIASAIEDDIRENVYAEDWEEE